MLIFLRHGNTFLPNQTPIWAGARTDIPLTPEGEAQAQRAAGTIANMLKLPTHEQKIPSAAQNKKIRIVCSPLKRTRRTAEIVHEILSRQINCGAPLPDARLKEIDYGQWEGLSTEQCLERFGAEPIEKWETESRYPDNMGWQPPLVELNKQLSLFLEEMRQELNQNTTIIAVTSNGILRLIHRLVQITEPKAQAAKVKTGHLCLLEAQAQGWHISGWNMPPV